MTVNQLVLLMFLLATASLMYDVTKAIGAVDVGTGVIGVFPYRTSIEDEKVSLALVVENQVMTSLLCALAVMRSTAQTLVTHNFIL